MAAFDVKFQHFVDPSPPHADFVTISFQFQNSSLTLSSKAKQTADSLVDQSTFSENLTPIQIYIFKKYHQPTNW